MDKNVKYGQNKNVKCGQKCKMWKNVKWEQNHKNGQKCKIRKIIIKCKVWTKI